jgi:hypothetical protein
MPDYLFDPSADYTILTNATHTRLRDASGRFVAAPTQPTSNALPEGWRNNSRLDLAINPSLFAPSCGTAGCQDCPPISGGPFTYAGNDPTGYNYGGYDSDGYDSRGYDANNRDREGYDLDGYDREGYNRNGLDVSRRDREGYNADGFNRADIHRNGTMYNDDGYDRYGYNAEGRNYAGYDRNGYDSEGFDSFGYDQYGYNSDGYDREGYDSDGEDSYGNPRPCDCDSCEDCYDRNGPDESERELLHYYSYTPTLQFNGERPPFYGMEIEVTSDRIRNLVRCVDNHAPNLIYCKADGSVDGAELVTHPMSYEWAMANFPWNVLPALKDEADATVIASDNGIHIHVSRDGFDNSSHLYRWMKFWYRNPEDIQRIARRRANSWSAFRPEDRTGQFEHSKYGKGNYDSDNSSTRMHRYSAINTTNDATLEVRVFASTLRPRRAQAALQLVAGTVEYTRQLSADAITHRRGWDWRAFTSWAGKSGQYQALIMEDRTRRFR